jgi:hypothetical protein
MDDPVPEVGGEDFPELGLFGDKADGGRGAVGPFRKFPSKGFEMVFRVHLEPKRIGPVPLVLSAIVIGPVDALS